jgi:hypothetical protein
MRITRGNDNNPRNRTEIISSRRARKIQAFLWKKLSMIYPIPGLTNQAEMVMLLMSIIFSGEKWRVSLR